MIHKVSRFLDCPHEASMYNTGTVLERQDKIPKPRIAGWDPQVRSYPEEEQQETPGSLMEIEEQIEALVYRIWT